MFRLMRPSGCDATHAIRFDFHLFSAPFSGPLDWLLPVNSRRVQPRDGGTDFTSVLQGHSTGQSKKVDKEMLDIESFPQRSTSRRSSAADATRVDVSSTSAASVYSCSTSQIHLRHAQSAFSQDRPSMSTLVATCELRPVYVNLRVVMHRKGMVEEWGLALGLLREERAQCTP